MKKSLFLIMGILIMGLFSLGFVFAEENNSNQNNNSNGSNSTICSPACDSDEICVNNLCVDDEDDDNEDEENETEDEDDDNDDSRAKFGLGQTIRNRVKAGVFTNEYGQEIRVSELAKNRTQLRVRNISADCDCNLTEEFDQIQNRTKLKIKLSNGRDSELKIMPDRASETALERLRLKVCNQSNNCSIILKEVGADKGNQTRSAYEFKINRHEKLFGLFKMKSENKVQIDSETGEIINVKKAWWSFLAKDVEE